MSPFDIAAGVEYAKPLLYLFSEAYAKILEHSNDVRDLIFADLLENDPLACELWNYLNSQRLTRLNSAPYHIRKTLLLLDILSDHKILEMCKDIDPRGIHMFCNFFRVDFLSGVLGVPGDISEMDARYVEYYIKNDLTYFKAFIQAR